MRKRIGMTPGTDPHTYIAICSHGAPVIKAGLIIQFPAQCAINLLGIIRRDGVGWTTGCTFFANYAKYSNL